MGDVDLVKQVNKCCRHNTTKGIAWKCVINLLGIYTVIEKECQSCGGCFYSNTKGVRLTS